MQKQGENAPLHGSIMRACKARDWGAIVGEKTMFATPSNRS